MRRYKTLYLAPKNPVREPRTQQLSLRHVIAHTLGKQFNRPPRSVRTEEDNGTRSEGLPFFPERAFNSDPLLYARSWPKHNAHKYLTRQTLGRRNNPAPH